MSFKEITCGNDFKGSYENITLKMSEFRICIEHVEVSIKIHLNLDNFNVSFVINW